MRVEVNETKKVGERTFPKLMIADDGDIVLFIKERLGVQLISNDPDNIGTVKRGLFSNLFKDFEGEIILSND